MPMAPQRPCAEQGCPKLIREGNRCDEHRRAKEQSRAQRPDRQQDKAFFNSKAWQQVRREALIRDRYACQDCGRIQAQGLEGHHIKARDKHPDLALEVDNIVTLCTTCHNKREAAIGRRF